MRRRDLTRLAVTIPASSLTGLTARAADPEFKVGVVASVTGTFASPTKDTFDGLNAWIRQVGLPGRKLTFDTLDDETNPVNAANLFRRLAGDPSIALIYLFINSTSAIAAKSFASEFQVPIISGGGAETLGRPADPWLFKVAPANRDYMIAMSDYIQRKGYKTVAHLYSSDTFGQYDYTALLAAAAQYGYSIAAAEKFAADDTNFNAQWTRIRAAKPDIVYSSATGRAAAISFRQFKQSGITAPLIVAGPAISQAFFQAIGGADKADGLLTLTQLGSIGEAAGGTTAQYITALKTGLDGRTPVFFNTFGWDVGVITAAALAKSDGSRQGIRDALESLHDLPALNGPVTYSPDDHTGQDSRSITVASLNDGTLGPAT
jgi:branched-chain amino acid transport system substrate-binding protein